MLSQSPKRRGNRKSKRVENKRQAARVFGNPLRNVSDNLVKLYKKSSRHKNIIPLVYQNLGYSKKLKNFTKLPILLKDFIYNLHDEIIKDNESPGKSKKIKQEDLGNNSNKKVVRSNKKNKRELKAIAKQASDISKTDQKANLFLPKQETILKGKLSLYITI